MNIKSFLKINVLLLAGFIGMSANAATIILDTDDVFGTYSGNDGSAADFIVDTGITGVTELFRDEDFCDSGVDCATPNGVTSGTVTKVEYLDYLVVKFDGVYGVYDVMSYSVGDDLEWHTADFLTGCEAVGGNNCGAATSHVTGYGVVPVPAAAWLFGSGLLGLVGVARRKKA